MALPNIESVWTEHIAGEFTSKNVEATLATVVETRM